MIAPARHPAPRWPDLLAVRRAFLLGAAGIGMRGAATLLSARGIEVWGSDGRFGEGPGDGHWLDRAFPESAPLPPNLDLVVRSAAIDAAHGQRNAAQDRGVPSCRLADLVGALMAETTGIAVAGCHGKTTTSALVASALLAAGRDPSFLLGGTLRAIGATARAGAGPFFVAESCEFDRSFLAHRPVLAAVTNVDADHLDCFAGLQEIQEAFVAFAALLPPEGVLVVHESAMPLFSGRREVCARVESYGVGAGAHWRVEAPAAAPEGERVSVRRGSSWLGTMSVPLLGLHNALNATAALALLHHTGLSYEEAAEALSVFGGVDRRLQVLSCRQDAWLYDDYGHHPAEIVASLAALRRRHPSGRLRVVFQPHQASRTRHFLEEFAQALSLADEIWLLPIFLARDSDEDRRCVSSDDLAAAVWRRGGVARVHASRETLPLLLLEDRRPGDVILTMGAGDIDEVALAVASQF